MRSPRASSYLAIPQNTIASNSALSDSDGSSGPRSPARRALTRCQHEHRPGTSSDSYVPGVSWSGTIRRRRERPLVLMTTVGVALAWLAFGAYGLTRYVVNYQR